MLTLLEMMQLKEEQEEISRNTKEQVENLQRSLSEITMDKSTLEQSLKDLRSDKEKMEEQMKVVNLPSYLSRKMIGKLACQSFFWRDMRGDSSQIY